MSFDGRLGGSSTAVYQACQAARQLCVVNYIEQPAPAVLTARAFWSRGSALLIHVTENRIMITTRGRHAKLGMIEVCPGASGQAELLAVPMSGRGNFHAARLVQGIVPAGDLCRRGRRIDFGVRPPGGGPQRRLMTLE